MNTIGEKLRARRTDLGLSLRDVAEATGVSRGTVQRWESGSIKNMGRDKIDSLARVLQIAPTEIFRDSASEKYMSYDPSRPQMTPQQEVLFDATEDLTPKEMDAVLAMIQALKSTRKDG